MIFEVKIQCGCGTRYKFDVEPWQGRMPSPVHCPGCGFPGTDEANAQLQKRLAPAAVPLKKTAPIPPATSLTRSAPASVELLLDPAPAPRPGTPKGGTDAEHPQAVERFALGVMGAVAMGLLAALGWFFVIKWTSHPIGFAAWGVGLLVGLGTRAPGRQGSRRLGWVAAGCALAAILGGQWFATPMPGRGGALNFTQSGVVGALTCVWLLLAAASAWKLGAAGTRR